MTSTQTEARRRMALILRTLARVSGRKIRMDEIDETWLLPSAISVVALHDSLSVCYRPDLVAAMDNDLVAMQAALRAWAAWQAYDCTRQAKPTSA